MTEPLDRNDDAQFEALFRDFGSPLADDGFSANVMRRVRRQVWARRIVVSAAAIVGGAMALAPLSQFSLTLSEGLVTLATHWNDLAWLTEHQTVIAAALLMAVVPPAIRWLEN